jgi:hypothetical protein
VATNRSKFGKHYQGAAHPAFLNVLKHLPNSHDPDSFNLIAESRKQVEEVATAAREAIQANCTEPAQLAAFMEGHHTPVFVLNNAPLGQMALLALGYELGFIPPGEGRRYRMLQSLLSNQATRLSPHPAGDEALANGLPHGVIVLTRPVCSMAYLSHQLHHWLAFRSGMQGYSDRSQKLYRHFWQKNQGNLGREVYKMTADDLLALKAAINRDMEALKFLRAITCQVFIPAQQARRLSEGSTSA